ncbi:hypothetical protein GG804_11655 [Sphingomonas histidinilytica]|jgi:hypothetical protein|uniref:hypothetical protein n=1 Tax=Rhizorhabdus histidinilytica TaxID=439228 RepID=UPI001AD98511|nr:hypothetical protein [Rhizorhabdus histidinilytica]MBO9377424.1 hypothetical protein [Rhizorhabdus histidinilytica]
MATTETTRRSALGILATGPIAMLPALAVMQCSEPADAAPIGNDANLLAAWADRQSALMQIEARGSFFDSETHSPELADAFDEAELQVCELPATTSAGLLAKLWVAFSLQGAIRDEDDRLLHDAVRRADFDAVAANVEKLDHDRQVMFGVVKSLKAMVEAR